MTQDDAPDWHVQVVATVAAEVRRRRRELGMSAQELADACEEIGYAVPRNVIANMESGRRTSLPLVEVMVLAQALGTSPVCLLFPVGYAERTAMLPDRDPVDTWESLRWFTGEEDGIDANNEALSLYRLHQASVDSAQRAAAKAQRDRDLAAATHDRGERAEALRSAEHVQQRAAAEHQYLGRIRAELRADSLLLPSLPSDLVFVDETTHDPSDPAVPHDESDA